MKNAYHSETTHLAITTHSKTTYLKGTHKLGACIASGAPLINKLHNMKSSKNLKISKAPLTLILRDEFLKFWRWSSST